MKDLYDFPVELQDIRTASGKLIPGSKVLIRTDNDEPLNTVSNKYKITTHSELVNKARSLVSVFGDPKEKFTIAQGGKHMLATFEFMDKTQAIQKGDAVGFRVNVKGSYSATAATVIKIGGIRLSCMNGMVIADSLVEIKQRHTGDKEIEMPSPERLWDVFCQNTKRWSELRHIDMNLVDYQGLVAKAIEDGIIQQASEKTKTEGQTAWDLYNQFTHHITHESKASEFGKFNRLAKVDQWINNVFELQKVA